MSSGLHRINIFIVFPKYSRVIYETFCNLPHLLKEQVLKTPERFHGNRKIYFYVIGKESKLLMPSSSTSTSNHLHFNLGNIQRCTPIACYTTAPLYSIIIIFDTVVNNPDRNARIPVTDVQFSCTSVTYVRHKISTWYI